MTTCITVMGPLGCGVEILGVVGELMDIPCSKEKRPNFHMFLILTVLLTQQSFKTVVSNPTEYSGVADVKLLNHLA